MDDVGELGGKKKAKSLAALKEVDLALLVIDPFVKTTANKDTAAADPAKLALLGSLVAEVTKRGRQVRENLLRDGRPRWVAGRCILHCLVVCLIR